MDRRQRLLRALFFLCWAVGIGGYFGTPLARVALLDVRTGDAIDDALLALHPSNQWYHPHFYMPLRDAFRALTATLPAAADTLTVIALSGTQDDAARELLRRNLRVWAYPRQTVWCAVDTLETVPERCHLTEAKTIIVWGTDSLPERSCTAGDQGLTLCR